MMKKPTEKRTKIIRIRTTEYEGSKILSDAEIANLSLSELCRRKIFGRRITAKVDEKIINELRKIGGLLKQIFLEGQGTDDTKNILSEVKNAIQRIAQSEA